MFVATSLNREKAKEFRQNARFLLRIHIISGCLNACHIQHHSEYGHEQEVLIPPYSPFRIERIDTVTKEIHMVLLDGKEHEEEEHHTGVNARAIPI
jgi:hypothetical protein